MDNPLPRRFAPRGLVVAGIGFTLTRFTVTLAAYEDPVRFVIAGVVPLVLGLGLTTFGVALVVGDFDRAFVRTVTRWCVLGAASMVVLVFLTLVGNETSLAMEPVRSQTYLSNFLIGGSVGGALTGVYAGQSASQQDELRQQASQLEMVNRLLRDEVLNAITVIRGRAEVLRVRDDADSVTAIERRSEDVENTIQNVKHITRNGAATSGLDETSVDECVTEAVADIRSRYPDARVTVESTDTEDVAVWANSLLADAIRHLLENAVAYSDAHTPTAELTVTVDQGAVTISVADNGPGLPDHQRDLIDRGVIADYENRSTGFGLNIVRLLARSYDGAVDATVTDAGTTVRLTLRRVGGETDSDRARTLSKRKLGVASVASLVAGIAMGGILQTVSGSVPVIGALYGAGNVWVGWITHLFHSLVFGLVYAALVTLAPTRYGDTARYYGTALGWAFSLWVVAASLVMPLWLQLVGVSMAFPAFQPPSLVGHLLWGLILATVYQRVCSRTG